LARNRRPRIRIDIIDVLVIVALFVVMVGAIILWPEKFIADVAIPTAFLIAFVTWRES
jgi:hypothetical protein